MPLRRPSTAIEPPSTLPGTAPAGGLRNDRQRIPRSGLDDMLPRDPVCQPAAKRVTAMPRIVETEVFMIDELSGRTRTASPAWPVRRGARRIAASPTSSTRSRNATSVNFTQLSANAAAPTSKAIIPYLSRQDSTLVPISRTVLKSLSICAWK